jgi:hypothetical protein
VAVTVGVGVVGVDVGVTVGVGDGVCAEADGGAAPRPDSKTMATATGFMSPRMALSSRLHRRRSAAHESDFRDGEPAGDGKKSG